MKLILDSTEEVRSFRAATTFMEPWQPFFENTIDSILEYLAERDSALHSLGEYADVLEEELDEEGKYTPEQIRNVCSAMLKLGEQIHQMLVDVVAYAHHGELYYQYSDLDGYDIVLEPMPVHARPVDTSGGDDDEVDDEDPPF